MKPKVIGLTGGIGSGKSRVLSWFDAQGIPCYEADKRAKLLMNQNPDLQQAIIALFGQKAYRFGVLDRAYIGELVFKDSSLLAQLNALVHPAVAIDFDKWLEKQTSPYVIKEAAILFETGGYKNVDATLLITAPETLRINRVIDRDGVDTKAVKLRMQQQWEDEKKIPLADWVIENIDWEKTLHQLRSLSTKFLLL